MHARQVPVPLTTPAHPLHSHRAQGSSGMLNSACVPVCMQGGLKRPGDDDLLNYDEDYEEQMKRQRADMPYDFNAEWGGGFGGRAGGKHTRSCAIF